MSVQNFACRFTLSLAEGLPTCLQRHLKPSTYGKRRGDTRTSIGDLARLSVEMSMDLLNRRRFWRWLFSLCSAAATMGLFWPMPVTITDVRNRAEAAALEGGAAIDEGLNFQEQ